MQGPEAAGSWDKPAGDGWIFRIWAHAPRSHGLIQATLEDGVEAQSSEQVETVPEPWERTKANTTEFFWQPSTVLGSCYCVYASPRISLKCKFEFSGFGWGLRFCIPNKFTDDELLVIGRHVEEQRSSDVKNQLSGEGQCSWGCAINTMLITWSAS